MNASLLARLLRRSVTFWDRLISRRLYPTPPRRPARPRLRLEALEVREVLSAPVAYNDTYSVSGTVLTATASIGVLANDTSNGNGTLSASLVSPTTHGAVSLNADGSFSYTLMQNYSGQDSFTYRDNAGMQSSNTATVILNVSAPVAKDDSYSVTNGTLTTTAADGVLANDSANGSSYLSATLVNNAVHGMLSLNADGSFSYTGYYGYTGTDSFTYCDNAGMQSSNTATVTLNVVGMPAPVANDDSYSVTNGSLTTTAIGGVLANDTANDNGTLLATLVNNPMHGMLSLNADGSFSYTGYYGYSGTDSFTYRDYAGMQSSNTATVTLNVTGLQPPVANDDTYSVTNGLLTTTSANAVLANDAANGSSYLSATLVNNPMHGMLSLNADGSFSYTGYYGYSGTDSFTYRDYAGMQSSNTATVTLNVVGMPAPDANDDTYSVTNGSLTTTAAGGVLVNDTSNGNGSLSATLVNNPMHGMLSLSADGSFSYTGYYGYSGTDSFTYRDYAGMQSSNTATVTLNVVGMPAPVANDDTYSVTNGSLTTTAIGGVLVNDTSNGNGSLSATLVNNPMHGMLSLSADGSFSYTGYYGYSGTDSFTYRDYAGMQSSNTATVTLNVTGLQPPVANDDTYSVTNGLLTTTAASGVIANDSANGSSYLSATLVNNPMHGMLSLNADGSFSYTGYYGYSGTDSFTYRDYAGMQSSNTATVTLNVVGMPAPVANDDTYSVTNGSLTTTAAGGLLANDTSNGNGTLLATLVNNPMHGMLSLNADGSFSYTGYYGYSGTDSFTYRDYAGMQSSNTATVTLNVTGLQPPVANDDTYSVTNGLLTTTAASGVIANDSANGSSYLSATLVSSTMHGMLSLNADGSFNYTGYAGYSGPDSFTYRDYAGMQSSNTATVTLDVVGMPAPVASNDTYSVTNGALTTTAIGGVLANDTSNGNGTLSATLVNTTMHGMLSLNADGSFSYTGYAGYSGPDSFTYRDYAGMQSSNTATVYLNALTFTWTQVLPTAPTVTNPGNQTSAEGQAISLTVQAIDPSGGNLTYDALDLPPGLDLNPSTGIISGTVASPAAEYFGGNYATTLIVSSSTGGSTIQSFTWNVTPSSLALTAPGDQANAPGDTVSLAIQATNPDGNPLNYTATGLPTGLGVDPDTGEISGTIDPSAAVGASYTVTVTVDNGVGTPASETFNWAIVQAANQGIVLLSPGDQSNAVFDAIDLPLYPVSSQGDALSFTASGLPAGLSIDPDSGEITGTLSASAATASPYSVTVSAGDGQNTASVSFSWAVDGFGLANPGNQASTVGDQISLSLMGSTSSTAALAYTASGLPAGLQLDSETGIISGTLSGDTGGTLDPVSVTASDGTNSASQTFYWLVVPATAPTDPILANPGNQNSQAGDQVALQIQATGAPGYPLLFTATGLPDGLDIDPTTGVISGTVADDAVSTTPYNVTITADDGSANPGSQTFSWVVGPESLQLTVTPPTVVEGNSTGLSTIATFTTPDLGSTADEFTAQVNWGDGVSESAWVDGGNGTFTVTGDHFYVAAGNYPLSVTVTRPDGGTVTATGVATDAAASVTFTDGLQEGTVTGQAGVLVAEFSYGNPSVGITGFTAMVRPGTDINGDGMINAADQVTGVVTPLGNGLFGVTLPYGYTKAGPYAASVTVTDPHGIEVSTNATVEVGDLYAGLPATLAVATFTVGDSGAQPSSYSATIDWGDGTPVVAGVVSGSGGVFSVQGTHTYAVDSIDQPGGAYQVRVELTNGAGIDLVAIRPSVVTRPPLTMQVANNVIVQDDGTVANQLVASFEVSDLGDAAGWFQATINWGDGTSSQGVVTGGGGVFQVSGGHTYSTAGNHAISVAVAQHWWQTATVEVGAGEADEQYFTVAAEDKDTKAYWVAKANEEIAGYKKGLPKGAAWIDTAIARNKFITAAYAKLYLKDPKNLPWFGLGAIASNEVGGALIQLRSELQLAGKPDSSWETGPTTAARALLRAVTSATAAVLGEGNAAVYVDIYWQGLAYESGGIKQMERIYAKGDMTDAEIGYWRSVSKDAWAGNLELFEHEQKDILQPYFNKMPIISAWKAAEYSLPLFPGATRFGNIGKNFADLDARWDKWIVAKLWPQWETFSTDPKKANWVKGTMKRLANPAR